MNLDWNLFQFINGLAGQVPLLDTLAQLVANDYVVLTGIVSLLFLLWFSGNARIQAAVLRAALALFVANGIVKLFNLFWMRPRPFTHNEVNLLFYHPSDSSFPSNITAAAFALGWVIWRALPDQRRYGALILVSALLLGLARIFVGVHYPFDILGGALVGIFAATLVERFAHLFEPFTEAAISLAERLKLT